MKQVFFYGLFMDPDVLKDQGYKPGPATPCFVEGYKLLIGGRASLIKSKDSKSYGTVMALSEEDLKSLYSDDTLKDYLPQPIAVTCIDGTVNQARVYLLPEEQLSGVNHSYASLLARVAKKIGLPETYINEIKSFVD